MPLGRIGNMTDITRGWWNGKITYPLRFFFSAPVWPPSPSPLLPYMVSFHHVFMFFSELVIKKDLPKTSKWLFDRRLCFSFKLLFPHDTVTQEQPGWKAAAGTGMRSGGEGVGQYQQMAWHPPPPLQATARRVDRWEGGDEGEVNTNRRGTTTTMTETGMTGDGQR